MLFLLKYNVLFKAIFTEYCMLDNLQCYFFLCILLCRLYL